MIRERKLSIFYVLLLFFYAFKGAFAAEVGDALQLLSYRVTATTKPDVTDGQIAASTDPTDWTAAYVRVMTIAVDGDTTNDTRSLTFLVANDLDSLYIGVAVELPNASELNRVTIYFDQDTPGVRDGAPGAPGEYYVTMLANGSAPADGHYNGNGWNANITSLSKGFGVRKGAGGLRLYNFEIQMPLKASADASNSYLNLNPNDEVGMLVMITDNGGNDYFWYQTNADTSDPSATGANGSTGWGEIQTIGAGTADRDIVSLFAKDIVPVIDGDISDDNDWRYAFSKDIILSDFSGNKLDGSLKIKEQAAPDNLLFGITVENVTPAALDYLAIYFDHGADGGNLNYILTEGGDPKSDHASRVLGNGTYQDYYFDTNNWTADAASSGSGAGGTSGGDWEVEISMPLSSGDVNDLDIATGDVVGLLLKYYDSTNDRNYWWSATINSEKIQIDPVDPVYNSLGWGLLQTGGPFIQPIYPEDGDTLSGEYPLAIYTIDPSDPVPETGIESIGYEVRKEDQATGSVTILLSGTMTKIEDDDLAIWTGTVNTRNITESPSTPLKLVYRVYDGEIDTVSVPIDIFVNNEALTTVDDPSLSITSPVPNASLSGTGVNIDFSVTTREPLIIDTVRVYIDGNLMQTYLPSSTSSYSNTYSWNTTTFLDGEHVIQIWGVNSLGLENFSPSVLVTTSNAPSVNITSPSASALISGTVTVNFVAAPVSPSTLANTEISIDGASWANVTVQPPPTGGSGSHNLNTLSVPDGTHTIQIRTTDNTGKIGYSDLISIITDNTTPTGSLTATPNLVKDGDGINFSYYSSETGLTAVIPVAQLQLLDNQASSDLILTDNNNDGIYTANYNVDNANTVTDGVKTLTATITDNANNTYGPQLTITLDNTGPWFLSLFNLDDDNIYRNGETINLKVEVDEESDYIITCDFSKIDDSYIPGTEIIVYDEFDTYISYTLSETNSIPNGQYCIDLVATDEVGLTDLTGICPFLDNKGPIASNLVLVNDDYLDGDNIINADDYINATVTDEDNNIKSAEYFIDVLGLPGEGIAMDAVDGGFNSNTELVYTDVYISGLDDGKHTIYVRGQDVSGEWGNAESLLFTVDRAAPAIEIVEVAYPDGQKASRNGQIIVISALIRDATTQIDGSSVLLKSTDVDENSSSGYVMVDDGTGDDKVASDGVYTSRLTVTSVGTGIFNFTIEADDIVPNSRQISGSVAIDNTAPLFTDLVCLDPDTIYSNGETILLQVSFDASGYSVACDFSEIDTAYVSGAEAVEDIGNSTYNIRYTLSETNSRDNGTYTITAVATDGVGLTANGTIDLVLDNRGPVVSGLALLDDDDILNSDDTMYANVTDDDTEIKSAEYYVDVIGLPGEGSTMSVVDGTFNSQNEAVTANFSISGLAEGQHKLFVRGQDLSGQWGGAASLLFTVDRVAPTIEVVGIEYPEGQKASRNSQTVVISALIRDATSQIDADSVLLRSIDVDTNSSPGYVMKDDGAGDDKIASDGVYTSKLTVTSDSTGVYDFTIEAADIVPNSRQISGSVEIDNTAPVFVDLICLDPDTIYTNGETILLLASFDTSGYSVSCDFSEIDTAFVSSSEHIEDKRDGTYRIRYTISELNIRDNGVYTITVYATDGVGLSASGTIDLVLDNRGPVVSNLVFMDTDAIFNSDDSVSANVTDIDADIKYVEYYIDVIGLPGEGSAMSADDGSFDSQSEDVKALLSISELTEGRHNLYVRGQDVSGEWGKIGSVIFTVDRIAPTIEVADVIYPEGQHAAKKGQKITITALIREATTQLDSSSILLKSSDVDTGSVSGHIMADDGTKGDKIASDGVFSAELTVTSDSTGEFNFTVEAADIVPNRRQIEGEIVIDNMKPNITVNLMPAPKNDEVYVNEILLTGSYYDLPDTGEVKEINIIVTNADGDNVNTSPIIVPANIERKFSRTVKLVEGENSIIVQVTDFSGNTDQEEYTLTFIYPSYTKYVDIEGGIVSSPDGTKLEIPENALLAGTKVYIKTVSTKEMPKPSGNIELLEIAHEFRPYELVFHKPVSITLTYNDSDLDIDQDGMNDFEEDSLIVFILDGNDWIKVIPDIRNIENNTVKFTTNHFSVFALGNVDSSSDFSIYWTSNPFTPEQGTAAVIELSQPGQITLKVYDLSGNLVRTLADKEEATGSTVRRWDGLNDFDRYVGSGIYIYIMEHENDAGEKNIIRKPIGVVK